MKALSAAFIFLCLLIEGRSVQLTRLSDLLLDGKSGAPNPTLPNRSRGPSSLLYILYLVSFPGVKRPMRSVNNKLYSSSGSSWQAIGRNLTLCLQTERYIELLEQALNIHSNAPNMYKQTVSCFCNSTNVLLCCRKNQNSDFPKHFVITKAAVTCSETCKYLHSILRYSFDLDL